MSTVGHMSIHQQEAPPPVSGNQGRAMLPTQASQHRTSAVLQAQPESKSPKKSPKLSGEMAVVPSEPSPSKPKPSFTRKRSISPADLEPSGQGGSTSGALSASGLKEKAPGEALEEAMTPLQ